MKETINVNEIADRLNDIGCKIAVVKSLLSILLLSVENDISSANNHVLLCIINREIIYLHKKYNKLELWLNI